MDLYLIRHAEAKALGENNVHEDAERALTEAGHAQAKALGAALLRHGIIPSHIVTSPLLRARQTAEGVVGELPKPAPELLTCADLAPGGKRRKLSRYLRNQGGEIIALVGHMPDLAVFAAWLIGSKKAQIDLAKGAVAHISCPNGQDKGDGILKWMVSPKWFGQNA